ncbi:DUF4232 domain-containing protein [Streptomyces sp. NPDC020800]|uniref:DUF4232 domain-containing protein n=1 Tax=Streptomyces sp. NPDC020800 TaxID=3365092 RepID=UPI0037A3EBAF
MPNRRVHLRLRRSALALTGAAALMAMLTACNGGGSAPKAVSGDASPAPAGSQTPASGGSASGGSASGASSSGGSSSAGSAGTTGSKNGGTGAASGGPAAAGSTPSCQASQLGYSWAGTRAAPSGGGQKQAVVALTNKSGHACALHGFPGVDLVNGGEQWSLQRSGTTPQPVTVAAGASAHFTITYLAWQKGDSAPFQPTTVVITAPNQRTSYDLPWRFGAVLKQDGATHPGTFVGPVVK